MSPNPHSVSSPHGSTSSRVGMPTPYRKLGRGQNGSSPRTTIWSHDVEDQLSSQTVRGYFDLVGQASPTATGTLQHFRTTDGASTSPRRSRRLQQTIMTVAWVTARLAMGTPRLSTQPPLPVAERTAHMSIRYQEPTAIQPTNTTPIAPPAQMHEVTALHLPLAGRRM